MTIRPGRSEDVLAILRLCQAHAAYEKLPFDLNGQDVRLNQDLFSLSPKLFCLVAEVDNEIVAYATYMKQYATWEAAEYVYMDCLFIREEFRSQGIGERLVERIKKESRLLGCSLIQWQTPTFNTRAVKFYKRIGAYSKAKERFFLKVTSDESN